MKKKVQITLVIILAFVLFQVVTGGPAVSSGLLDEHTSSNTSSTLTAGVADTQMAAACLVRIKGVGCVRPNVGWNS